MWRKKNYADTGGARNGFPQICKDGACCVSTTGEIVFATNNNTKQKITIPPTKSSVVRLSISCRTTALCVCVPDA